jgi:GT2 family glycosyltransferase
MKEKVDILIVSHNHGQFLHSCLSSIFSSIELPFKVLVIINNSKDQESQKIAKKFPVRIFVNKKEKGLAANLNYGIKMTKGDDYILVLNPDTKLTKKALENLVSFMEKQPKVAICGPKLVYPDGSLQFSTRRFPNFKTFLIRRLPVRRFLVNSRLNLYHLGADLSHKKTQPVDWVLGACMLIRRKAIEEIGFFDENYYLYVEDIDLCFRAWKKGW